MASNRGSGLGPHAAPYERARQHGLSHNRALEAVADQRLICWCGSIDPCQDGAQRFVGCGFHVAPLWRPYPDEVTAHDERTRT